MLRPYKCGAKIEPHAALRQQTLAAQSAQKRRLHFLIYGLPNAAHMEDRVPL